MIIHGRDHIRAALHAYRAMNNASPLEFWSPPDAVRWQGPRWLWLLCLTETTGTPPDRWTLVLDCGDAAGMALTALRDGIPAVAVHSLHATAIRTLGGVAGQLGQRLALDYPERLDLGLCTDVDYACKALLRGDRDAIKGALCTGPRRPLNLLQEP